MSDSLHQQRLDELLIRLETRAKQSPGMFPVTERDHWRQLARLHRPGAVESNEALWKTVEDFDR
ncbi:MAG: hypothetical protein AAF571_10050, partial [Verrucomicrobiota bacterium]